MGRGFGIISNPVPKFKFKVLSLAFLTSKVDTRSTIQSWLLWTFKWNSWKGCLISLVRMNKPYVNSQKRSKMLTGLRFQTEIGPRSSRELSHSICCDADLLRLIIKTLTPQRVATCNQLWKSMKICKTRSIWAWKLDNLFHSNPTQQLETTTSLQIREMRTDFSPKCEKECQMIKLALATVKICKTGLD